MLTCMLGISAPSLRKLVPLEDSTWLESTFTSPLSSTNGGTAAWSMLDLYALSSLQRQHLAADVLN